MTVLVSKSGALGASGGTAGVPTRSSALRAGRKHGKFSRGVLASLRKTYAGPRDPESAPRLSAPSGKTVWLPLQSRGVPARVLHAMAQESMRCIDWENISLELMTGAICTGTEMDNLFHLSRPTEDGEVPDFFLSHSWYDDPQAKFAKLSHIAEDFKRRQGRFPTFWLDKVCIDQDEIGDGLKALPVFVMTCKTFLALPGPSYWRRLWCAWELFTVVAFGHEPSDLVVEPLAEGALDALARFDVAEAHCFDPNEEQRLRRIINAFGAQAFNERMRGLADKCRHIPTRQPMRGTLRSQSTLRSQGTLRSQHSTVSLKARLGTLGLGSAKPKRAPSAAEGEEVTESSAASSTMPSTASAPTKVGGGIDGHDLE